MKWLILVLIFSCGQKNPPAKDVGDSDGDQILNYLEVNGELDKFTANVKPFAEVKATMTFRQGTKLAIIEMSNESNLYKISYNLLTKRADLMKLDEHFSEWSQMRILSSDAIPDFPEKTYETSIRFHSLQETPDHLVVGDTVIEKFASPMKIHFTGSELKDLLQNKISIKLQRAEMNAPHSESSTVRQRTYRVFFNDGKSTSVFYVSHELPFERFLKLKNISHARDIEDKQGLGWTDQHQDWWIRSIGEKDKVVIKASEKDISEQMENNFQMGRQEVKRNNGRTVKTINITKAPDARLFLKIRGTKETFKFVETTERYRGGTGREGGSNPCLRWIRNANSQGISELSSEEILNTLQVRTESKAFTAMELASTAYEALDESGQYLEVFLDVRDQNIQISMPNRAASTFAATGIYQWECDSTGRHTSPGVETNKEGHFTARVDTYVEKLED
ncbi:MAG: hypothetical protein V4598_16970 [Bdellovibrionota bacterium]